MIYKFKVGQRVYNKMVIVPENLRIKNADNWSLPIGWYTIAHVNADGLSLNYNGDNYQTPNYANYGFNRFIKEKTDHICYEPKNWPDDRLKGS